MAFLRKARGEWFSGRNLFYKIAENTLLLPFFYISILQEIWDISYTFISFDGVSPWKLWPLSELVQKRKE